MKKTATTAQKKKIATRLRAPRPRHGTPEPSPHSLEATKRGFRPPYKFSAFARRLFAFRANLYNEEWKTEYDCHHPRPPLKENPSHEDFVAYNQDRDPALGPDSIWGRRHFVEQQQSRGASGWQQLMLLGRVWKALGTEENRARALVLLDDASAEARQKKTRGGGYWKKTGVDREKNQKALQEARAAIEEQGLALITALQALLEATKAIAPFALLQQSFPHSAEAQQHVLTAECHNPAEIALCINDVKAALKRFRHIEDYDPAPKGPGHRGREKHKTSTVRGEIDGLFRSMGRSPGEALKFTHCLFYATGITSNARWEDWKGRMERERKRRTSSTGEDSLPPPATAKGLNSR